MNALLRYTLCALLLLLGQQSVHAAIGSVSDITGTPSEISRGKQKVAGTKGAEVESNDIVTTKGGVANIVFVDNTKVKVSENSRLLIDSFVYDPKKSDAGKLALKVGLGAVRYASGQIAKTNPQQVAVNTPTATVSVRGTDFQLIVDEAGRSLIVLLPSCREDQKPKQYELEENMCAVGKIVVTTLAGEVELDRAFQATYVASSTSRPTRPVVLNTVESNISSTLIVTMPIEIIRVFLASIDRKITNVGNIGEHNNRVETISESTIEYDHESVAFGNSYITAAVLQLAQQRQMPFDLITILEALTRQYTQSSQMNSPINIIATPRQLIELIALMISTADYTVTVSAPSVGSHGANTVSTLSGASYVQSTNMTQISVASVSQLISTCDTITKLCIVIDGQQQFSSTDGVLNNGTNPINYGSTLVVSRLSDSYEHYSQIRMGVLASNNLITLIQNDYVVSLAVGNAPDANRITINQRWGGR